jgi:hypothetical protein
MYIEGIGVQFLAWAAEFYLFPTVSRLRHCNPSKSWLTVYQLTWCNIPRGLGSSSGSNFNQKMH